MTRNTTITTAETSPAPPALRRFLRDWVKPYWPQLLLATVLMALVAGANSLYPLAVRWAVAHMGETGTRLTVLAPLAVIALTAFKAVTLYGQTLTTGAIALRIAANLQNALFGHVLAADYGQISRVPAGQWVSRFTNDIGLVRLAVIRALTNLVRDVLTIAGAIAVMLWMDWRLALLVFAFYPLAAWPVARIGKAVRALSSQAQAQLGRLTALLTESLSGMRMIKAYQLEDIEKARAAREFDQSRALALALVAKKARIDPLLELTGGIAFAAILVLASWRASGHGAPAANLVGFITALAVMAPAVRALGTLNAVWQEGAAALARLFAVLDEAPHIRDKPGARALQVSKGEVRFDQVSLSYGGGPKVLDGISFTARPGRTLALVGPSGAGKTSVLNLIARLYDPDSGTICIDGTAITDVTLSSLRAALALVSQDAVLFDATIAQNIAFGRPGASEEEIVNAARAAAADDFIRAQPQGYQTLVGEHGQRLSGGQKQRIALARALLKDAPILLLDEATSALDAPSEAAVQQALDRVRKGRTTIMIAHRFASVRKADSILVLDHGRVAESGTHESLMQKGGLYARLAEEQFIR